MSNNAKSSNVKIELKDFNFDPKTMQLIHHQFSGKRSNFIRNLDDLLGCWGMAGAANPNLHYNYELESTLDAGLVKKRSQTFWAEHAVICVEVLPKPVEFHPEEGYLKLENPKDLVKLYDRGYNACRLTAPLHTVASYFTLRETVARVSSQATWVTAKGDHIIAFFSDGEETHLAGFTLTHFKDLAVHVQNLNNATA